MFYVTTSGGFIQDNNFGYDYISKISTMMFGIPKVIEVKAEGLDIIGASVEDILNSTYKQISKLEV